MDGFVPREKRYLNLGLRGREKEGKAWQSSWQYNRPDSGTPVLGGFRETI